MSEKKDLRGSSGTDEESSGQDAAVDARRRFEDLREDVDFLIHEIRTPLTAMISSAEFLSTGRLSPEEGDSLLDIIRQEGLRINELLKDFRRFYQEESGTWLSVMSFSPVAVIDLLRDAAARFRNASSRHPVLVAAPAGLPPVRGDRKRLDLVLRNLLANAVKYSPEGGAIVLSAVEKDEEVVIGVRDQGMGIPEKNLATIFHRTFRVDRPECRALKGSGLGLAVVARILEQHGGRVWVESEPGKGSAFFFTLAKAE